MLLCRQIEQLIYEECRNIMIEKLSNNEENKMNEVKYSIKDLRKIDDELFNPACHAIITEEFISYLEEYPELIRQLLEESK